MKSILTFIFSLYGLFLFGQIVTDRPTQTTGPTTVPKGTFQLETGGVFSNTDGLEGQLQLPGNLFRIGLGKAVEIRIVNGLTFSNLKNKVEVSFSNVELGFKFQLLNKEDKKTQIGFIAHGFTSTGLNSLNIYERGSHFQLAFNHNLNNRNSIGYNFSYRFSFIGSFDNGDIAQNLSYTLNYAHALTERLGLFVEVYGWFNDFVYYDDNNVEFNFNSGLTYLIRDNLQLDYSFGFGILDRMNFQSLGLSFFIGQHEKK
jgi:hypothetical protein